MTFLRPVAGYTLWDKKEVREQLGINDKLTRYKINWREIYKEWMTTDYQKNVNCKPEGRRNIGRPNTRWTKGFREERTGQGA